MLRPGRTTIQGEINSIKLSMNLNTQSADINVNPSHRLADIVGTMIAMLTLVLPLFVIAHYSSVDFENPNLQSMNYNLNGNRK